MTYNKKDNYCTFSPDSLFGVTFNYGCYLHDRQYRDEVVNRKTRKQSDLDLRDFIFNSYKKKIGWIVSRIYYLAVRFFGGLTWKK